MNRLTLPPFSGVGMVGMIAQSVALAAIVVLGAVMGGVTLLSLTGVLPWLEVEAGFGGVSLPWAGIALQSIFTVFCISLCFFLPANRRILKLEQSHRDFHVNMEDVARAYRVSHAADRTGLFRAASEFDSVRERINHLRNHPDLGALEPGVMEVAAQMSHEARELAGVYSDDKVQRAREFLRHRQEEAARMQETIGLARDTCSQLQHWLLEVQTEEALVKRHLSRLEKDLLELMPNLGFEMSIEDQPRGDTVVPLNRPRSEQATRQLAPPRPVNES